jgi:hypothetical protein
MRSIAWTTTLLLAIAGAACGGDDDDAAVDAGPPDAAGAVPSCTEYCTRITTNCSGVNAQYADMGTCMNYCTAQAWTPGVDDAAQDGDTLGCRQYHAGAAGATGMPNIHCPHAGATGGAVCGAACEVYCDNLESNCTGANAQYADRAACDAACAAMTVGTPTDQSGDTTYCRVYHSGVPSFGDPVLHCPHAAADPEDFCVP